MRRRPGARLAPPAPVLQFPARIGRARRRTQRARMPSPTAPPTTSRAWLILGGAFLAFTVGAELMHSYTVFLVAFIAEFGWTRAEISLAYSVGAAGRRLQLAAGRRAGRPAGPAAAGAARRQPAGRRAWSAAPRPTRCGRWSLLYGVVMTSAPIASGCWSSCRCCRGISCATARHGDLGRAVGQRLRPRRLGAAQPDADRRRSAGAAPIWWQAAFMARGDCCRWPCCSDRRGAGSARAAVAGGRGGATALDPGRGDPHAAFLAAVRGLHVHRPRQLPGVAAPDSPSRSMSASTSSTPPACSGWARSWRCRA